MTLTLTTDEFKLLRDLIEKECGIALSDDKGYLIESRLAKLVIESGCQSYRDFYLKAQNKQEPTLKLKIIDAMTTNETLWFRDETPYMTLKEILLPEQVKLLREGKIPQIRIWSAACSTGQEPYSIAMMIFEYAKQYNIPDLLQGKASILATDICSSALTLAKLGRYDTISISRGMLPNFKENYFQEQNRVWAIKEDVKKLVTFQQFNLQQPFTTLGKFDLIFMRNVAIYFSPEFKTCLYEKLSKALNPTGYLILGATESVVGYSNEFITKDLGKMTVYQAKS
jgi:chemotaxis protein methyltransferase CheR